jgi:hypothetical protein
MLNSLLIMSLALAVAGTKKIYTNITTKFISQTMYYDSYEYEFGDGFYPQINKDDLDSELTINFVLNENVWTQTNSSTIVGLDGCCGEQLLQLLNTKCSNSVSSGQIIKNRNDKVIYCSKQTNKQPNK